MHRFRHMVADELWDLWPERADRIRECGEGAVALLCRECGSVHLYPVRCSSRTCPQCARVGAAALTQRILERIPVHDVIMRAEPWDGPGDPSPWSGGGDPQGRAWKLVTLTSPAGPDGRFDPGSLRVAVKRVRKAVGVWWRLTDWGRQVRDLGSRSKRVRRDTTRVCALEVAPGGMVHVHALVYGEYIEQRELARAWGKALGLGGPAIVHIRAVDPADPARGIREALKYATKGEGSPREQAVHAAAVEYAFRNVHRVSIAGALRESPSRSKDPVSEDVEPADLHDECESACEACGVVGSWAWAGIVSHAAVEQNGGWGLVSIKRLRLPP